MKKVIGLLALVGILGLSAWTLPRPTPAVPTAAAIDTTLYKDYVGQYAMKDAPFQTVVVTIESGKLMGEAVDQGKGELVPDEKTADQFSVPNYEALVVFNRDADKKVKKMRLTVQGQTFEGEKQP